MSEHACVVGSGPAAVACANTLSRSCDRVTILDVGTDLDDRSTTVLERFQRDGDASRFLREVHRLRSDHAKLSRVQPGKHIFGSDHPYRTIPETAVASGDDAVIRSSLARGGLTTVWGATVSTAVPKDIGDWPISFGDLEPHYRGLDELMSVASPPGEMRDLFPMDIGSEPTFPLSAQGQNLLDRLKANADELREDGIHVGRAKLAVGPKYSRNGLGCTPCGLCMHGCPNQAIFNAAYALESLLSRSGVEYRAQTLVESFSEQDGRVRVRVMDLTRKARCELIFDRLFIACGVVNSTAIVARSLGMTDHEFTIRDSQKYILPMLVADRGRGAVRQEDNTLAQIYLAVDNPDVSDHIVQVQYYGYNDLVIDPLRSLVGYSFSRALSHVAAPLLERMMIVFVYLHSHDSGALSLRVHELDDGSGLMGEVVGLPNPRSSAVIQALIELLGRHRRVHRGVWLRAGLQTTRPGDSQHIGGTLPMSREPNRHETDVLGRPHSCKRVHVVDASVFPSVPGTPIAYTAMANASRIAEGASREARA